MARCLLHSVFVTVGIGRPNATLEREAWSVARFVVSASGSRAGRDTGVPWSRHVFNGQPGFSSMDTLSEPRRQAVGREGGRGQAALA
jgi:hypothetical protein